MKKATKEVLAEDAFIKEVSDEVKSDKMKSLWNQYGLVIILLVAAILTATVSFETFRNWANKRNQEVSNAYAVAVSLQNQGKLDESLKLLQNISERSSVYGDIARLQMANIYFEQNKTAEAVDILEYLSHSRKVSSQMQEIASLKLAAYKLDNNAPAGEVKSLLEPLTDDENGSSYNVARELLAMLYIRDGNLGDAKTQYEQIIASANSSDALKSRARDMITIINDQNK